MARRWNKTEENFYRDKLKDLYVKQNKTIAEIGFHLKVSEKTVFDRLKRLGISTNPKGKVRYCNRSRTVTVPNERSAQLPDF